MSRKVDPWVRLFDVTDSKRHDKGYTVYKIVSTVSDGMMGVCLSTLIIESKSIICFTFLYFSGFPEKLSRSVD